MHRIRAAPELIINHWTLGGGEREREGRKTSLNTLRAPERSLELIVIAVGGRL